MLTEFFFLSNYSNYLRNFIWFIGVLICSDLLWCFSFSIPISLFHQSQDQQQNLVSHFFIYSCFHFSLFPLLHKTLFLQIHMYIWIYLIIILIACQPAVCVWHDIITMQYSLNMVRKWTCTSTPELKPPVSHILSHICTWVYGSPSCSKSSNSHLYLWVCLNLRTSLGHTRPRVGSFISRPVLFQTEFLHRNSQIAKMSANNGHSLDTLTRNVIRKGNWAHFIIYKLVILTMKMNMYEKHTIWMSVIHCCIWHFNISLITL